MAWNKWFLALVNTIQFSYWNMARRYLLDLYRCTVGLLSKLITCIWWHFSVWQLYSFNNFVVSTSKVDSKTLLVYQDWAIKTSFDRQTSWFYECTVWWNDWKGIRVKMRIVMDALRVVGGLHVASKWTKYNRRHFVNSTMTPFSFINSNCLDYHNHLNHC